MSTIAVVGAGPGMGLAIAKTFGTHGFDVALISRHPDRLDRLVAALDAEDITAKGFAADVFDRDALTRALVDSAAHFGTLDVLEFSPGGGAANTKMVTPSQSTAADVQREIDFQLYAAMAATHAVLPAMRAAGTGTLLYTTGAGSVDPTPMLGNINAAGAALRNWAINLHQELAPEGIQAAHVAIGVWIGTEAPAGAPAATADRIAPVYWDLHVDRDRAEHVFTV